MQPDSPKKSCFLILGRSCQSKEVTETSLSDQGGHHLNNDAYEEQTQGKEGKKRAAYQCGAARTIVKCCANPRCPGLPLINSILDTHYFCFDNTVAASQA